MRTPPSPRRWKRTIPSRAPIQIGSDLLVSDDRGAGEGRRRFVDRRHRHDHQPGWRRRDRVGHQVLSVGRRERSTPGDVLLDGSRAVPDLAAGASSAGSTSVTIPAGNAAGTFYLIAKADADGDGRRNDRNEQHEVAFDQHRSRSHDLDCIGVVRQRPGWRSRERDRYGDESGRRDGGVVDHAILFVQEHDARCQRCRPRAGPIGSERRGRRVTFRHDAGDAFHSAPSLEATTCSPKRTVTASWARAWKRTT